MELAEERLEERVLYEGRVLKFCLNTVKLPDGNVVEREHILHLDTVAVLALDDQDNCILVEQYRRGIGKVMIEIPAGTLDDEQDRTILDGARREFEEETGYTADSWTYMGTIYPAAGLSDEIQHLYLARDIKQNFHQKLDDDEFINVKKLPLQEVRRLIATGEITDCAALCALMVAQEQGRL